MIDRLSGDLQDAFPRTSGFSPRNLRDMKRFYLAYSDDSIWRQPVAKLDESAVATLLCASAETTVYPTIDLISPSGSFRSDLL